MHSYCLAAADLNLKHQVRDDLADRTPYNRVSDPYTLHYDLKHECSDFSWDKREYLENDLLIINGDKLPVPDNAPNKLFLEVFNTLNEALDETRKKIR